MFCQKCGTEVTGAFCPNCGTAAGAAGVSEDQIIVHENAIVKPRYKTSHIVLAGYLGLTFLITTLVAVGMFVVFFFKLFELGFTSGGIGMLLGAAIGAAVCGFLTFLCYNPGLKSIRQNTPKEEIKQTTKSFFIKSLIFIITWGFTLAGCVYIIGLFFKVWRVGLAVSRPKDNEYTAFVNGKKIPVFRIIDLEFSNHETTRYLYVDDNGEYYRPALR